MFLGAALLIGLTRQQLRAVLAHELGHYSGRHTALGALTYRGKEAIGRVLTDLEGSFVRTPLELYGRLYLAVSQTVNRRQELEADRLSAELVGSATAAEALQQSDALDPAWRLFLDRYVAPGEDVGCRPRDLFDGFRRFVADPERQRQLAEVRANLQDPPRSIYDSHPPTTERLAAFRALDAGGGQADTSEPAATLLRDPQADLARLGEALYQDSALRPVVVRGDGCSRRPRGHRPQRAGLPRRAARARGSEPHPRRRCGGTEGGAVRGVAQAGAGHRRRPRRRTPHGREPPGRHHRAQPPRGRFGDVRTRLGRPAAPHRRNGRPLDPWTPAYEALTADDDAVQALEAWLDHHGVRRDLELPPFDRARSASG